MWKVLITAITAAFVLVPLSIFAAGPQAIYLNEPRFKASGQGDVTTTGAIAEGATTLSIADAATWRVGHGIRVRRAGDDALVHTADAGWTLPPGAPVGAAVMHDAADKKEGAASVQCSFTGTPPDTDGDGTPGPVDLCEVDLGGPPTSLAFDELRFWIKSHVATHEGDLRLRILGDDRIPTFDLDIPALAADTWTQVFVELKRKRRIGVVQVNAGQFVALRCTDRCDGIVVHLDDFVLVQDLVRQVMALDRVPGGGATLTLDRPAGRTVSNETVYHDDTVAVLNWLRAAEGGGATLFAPPGVYYINTIQLPPVGGLEGSFSLPLYNDTRLRCAHPRKTIFKNTGGSRNGPKGMFRAAAAAPANIIVENCGFDSNGWNLEDFLAVITIKPQLPPPGEEMGVVRNIRIRGNNFFDSASPGIQGCDFDRQCVTRQRQYILVQRVDGVWIEANRLSGGGRIKTGSGGLGRHMYIRNNVLNFVNDNGITIVDAIPGVTEHVEISDNTIVNPAGTGIFFGADGETAGLVEGMVLRDLMIARNHVSGFFVGAGILGQLPRTTERVQIVDNVVQNTRDTDISRDFFVSGIFLSQESAMADPATDLRVEGNTVLASGIHAVLNVGGMVLRTRGAMRGVTIAGNEVRCEGCPIGLRGDALAAGIWLWFGTFDDVVVHGNRVVRANDALQLGAQNGLVTTITGASIENNEFLDSRNPFLGQITISTFPSDTVEARIAGNRIHGGAGYGILCSGGGTVLLTDLLVNDFGDNVAGDISGCP